MKKIDYAPLKDIDFTSSKTMKKKLDQAVEDLGSEKNNPTGANDQSSASGESEAGPSGNTTKEKKEVYKASAVDFTLFMSKISQFKPVLHSIHPEYMKHSFPLI